MTVGETIPASSLVPVLQAPPPVQVGQQSSHPPLDQVSAAGVQHNAPVQVVSHESVSNSGVVRSNSNAHPPQSNTMVGKVNQEILTSLHFIKDIRRLEKYQRDFFLKVKESLTHVHVLLDHQLMDMAWADNLADCEENLLKCSTCVQNSSSSQLLDAYNVLSHDRERLNSRFQELSVKSSLSEFVVNSRQLLDINAVRVAAEAILKGENPIPAQGDNTVPVDHTFFLANFCTTSLASSMMASFVPKPVSINQQQGSSKLIVSGLVSEDPTAVSGSYNQPHSGQGQQPSMYDNSPRGVGIQDKKINVNLVTSPVIAGNQVQQQIQCPVPVRTQTILPINSGSNNIQGNNTLPANINSSNTVGGATSPEILAGNGVRGHSSGSAVKTPSDGIRSIQTSSPHTSTNGIDYNMTGSSLSSGAPDFNSTTGNPAAQPASGTATNLANMYDSAGGLDKFLLTAAAAKDGTAADRAAVVAAAEMAVSNGMYGHELVSAISQITNQTGSTTSQNVTVKSKSPQKPQINPWGKISNSNEETGLGPATSDPSPVNTNADSRGYINRSNNPSRGGQPSKGNANVPSAGSTPSNAVAELNLPNDNTSDSVSIASDEGSRGGTATVTGGNGGDLSVKPLSFARIASLNLEKQAIHRPNINSNQIAAVDAAQALGVGQGGTFPPNLPLQMVNAMGTDSIAHQTNTNSMTGGSPALPHSTGSLQMPHGAGASIAASLTGSMAIGQGGTPNGPHNLGAGMSNVSGNGHVLQASHFSNSPQYPLQQQHSLQSQSNSSVGQLHVGGGMMNPLGCGGNHLQQQASTTTHLLMHSLPPTSNPRFYFDITMEGKRLGRVIIEVQPSIAPKMSHNFNQLVTAERGFGYKGCHFFQAWRNESVICGDWEHNSGRGGRAAIEDGPLFTPDDTRLPCIRGAVGMRRMSKKHSSLNQVAILFAGRWFRLGFKSQFYLRPPD